MVNATKEYFHDFMANSVCRERLMGRRMGYGFEAYVCAMKFVKFQKKVYFATSLTCHISARLLFYQGALV